MCAISLGSLLLVTSMGVVMISFFYRLKRVFLCYDTTGSSDDKSLGGAWAILGKTLSHMDLVLVFR